MSFGADVGIANAGAALAKEEALEIALADQVAMMLLAREAERMRIDRGEVREIARRDRGRFQSAIVLARWQSLALDAE
jgi:hypothetical protein